MTTTDVLDDAGHMKKSTDHGYDHSVATVNYQYNAKGQVVGATGVTVGHQNSKVYSVDLDRDNTIAVSYTHLHVGGPADDV